MFPGLHLRSNSLLTSDFLEQLQNFTMCDNHKYGRIIWCVVSIFFFFLGFPAYIFILYEWYKKYKSGAPLTPNVFFMLNLSIMDLVFLVFLPVGLSNHFIWHIWRIEEIWNGVYALSVCGRPLLMACVCIDCYLAVVHPLMYRNWTTLTPRIIVAVVVWLFTFAVGLAFGLIYSVYMTFLSVGPYFAAVVIIIICDCFILHTLMKTGPGGKNIHPQKQRAMQTLINSLVVSVVSYIPPLFMFTIGKNLIVDTELYYCSVSMPMTLFCTMGSAVMPLLFLHNLARFDRVKLWCSKIL